MVDPPRGTKRPRAEDAYTETIEETESEDEPGSDDGSEETPPTNIGDLLRSMMMGGLGTGDGDEDATEPVPSADKMVVSFLTDVVHNEDRPTTGPYEPYAYPSREYTVLYVLETYARANQPIYAEEIKSVVRLLETRCYSGLFEDTVTVPAVVATLIGDVLADRPGV